MCLCMYVTDTLLFKFNLFFQYGTKFQKGLMNTFWHNTFYAKSTVAKDRNPYLLFWTITFSLQDDYHFLGKASLFINQTFVFLLSVLFYQMRPTGRARFMFCFFVILHNKERAYGNIIRPPCSKLYIVLKWISPFHLFCPH